VRCRRLPAAVSAGLTTRLTTRLALVTMSAVTVVAVGFTATAATAAAAPASPGSGRVGHGKETLKIVATEPGPRHAPVYATGAFAAKGYFFRKRANIIFPHGKLAVHRQLLSTTNYPPDLAACTFKAIQTGTFQVFYATGWYRHVRYSGQFQTTITGHLKKSGHDQCTSKIVSYRAVTYEVGSIP
jgi:hypothetical protein